MAQTIAAGGKITLKTALRIRHERSCVQHDYGNSDKIFNPYSTWNPNKYKLLEKGLA